MLRQSRGAAADAERWAAGGGTQNAKGCGPSPARKWSRVSGGRGLVPGPGLGLQAATVARPRYLNLRSPPNKPMHPTRDTPLVIFLCGAGRRVMRGVRPLPFERGLSGILKRKLRRNYHAHR
jgi:hypothetical protein